LLWKLNYFKINTTLSGENEKVGHAERKDKSTMTRCIKKTFEA